MRKLLYNRPLHVYHPFAKLCCVMFTDVLYICLKLCAVPLLCASMQSFSVHLPCMYINANRAVCLCTVHLCKLCSVPLLKLCAVPLLCASMQSFSVHLPCMYIYANRAVCLCNVHLCRPCSIPLPCTSSFVLYNF